MRVRSLVAVRFSCAVSCVSFRRVRLAPTGRLRVRLPCVCVSVSVRRACAYRCRASPCVAVRRALPSPCAVRCRSLAVRVSVLRRSSVRFGACASSFVVGAYVRCVVRVVSASVRSVVRNRRFVASCVAFVCASCRALRSSVRRVVRGECVSCAVPASVGAPCSLAVRLRVAYGVARRVRRCVGSCVECAPCRA